MAQDSWKVKKSLNIEPKAAPSLTQEGDFGVSSSDSQAKAYLGGALRSLVTDTQAQTLTNKTIDGASNTLLNASVADGSITTVKLSDSAVTTAKVSDASITTAKMALDAYLELPEIATPSTPASGKVRIYAKSDNSIYKIDDLGIESVIGSGGGGGMSNPMTTLGDLIYGGASGVPTRVGIGSESQILSVVSGLPAWATPSPIAATVASVGGAPASVLAGDPIIFPTAFEDTSGGYNATTGEYTVPKDGPYGLIGYFTASPNNVGIDVFLDGTLVQRIGANDNTGYGSFQGMIPYATVGQIITVRPGANITSFSSDTILNIFHVSGGGIGSGATGDVVGPASSSDNVIASFDGTSGKLLKNSALEITATPVLRPTSASSSLTVQTKDNVSASGAMTVKSGGSSGNTGAVTIGSGNSSGGNSGDINLSPGTAGSLAATGKTSIGGRLLNIPAQSIDPPSPTAGSLVHNTTRNAVRNHDGNTWKDLLTPVFAASNWTTRQAANTNQWSAITWSSDLGIFAAVSVNGGSDQAMTSLNGMDWTQQTTPATPKSWTDIAWGNGVFVAVASNGTSADVMTSPDGTTWTARTPAANLAWSSVAYSASLTLFAAVASNGTGNGVMTSPDGITWTSRTPAADQAWNDIVWAPELGLFVAVSYDPAIDQVMTSPDGINWTLRSTLSCGLETIEWSPALGLLVAGGDDGTDAIVITSSDGITWNPTVIGNIANYPASIKWSEEWGLFVMALYSTTPQQVYISVNGTTWQSRMLPSNSYAISASWSPSLGVFAMPSNDTAGKVFTSLYYP